MGKTQSVKMEIIKTALELGVVQAAVLHGVNRKSVSIWLQKYKAGGSSALANKSRACQKQPKAMPAEIVSAIIKIKQEQPQLSAARIKEILNIQYSKTAIQKKILQLPSTNNIEITPQNIAEFYVGYKKIESNTNECNYLIYLINCWSNLLFTALAKEKSSLHSAVFINYFIENQQVISKKNIGQLQISTSDKLIKGAYKLLYKRHVGLTEFIITERPQNANRVLMALKNDEMILNGKNSVSYSVCLDAFQLRHNFQYSYDVSKLSLSQKEKLFLKSSQMIPFTTDNKISSFINPFKPSNNSAVQAIDNKKNRQSGILLLQNFADSLVKRSDLTNAQQIYKLLQNLTEIQSDSFHHQIIWQKLGVISQKMSDWTAAEFNYRQALKICLDKNIPKPLAHIYGALGVVFFLSGNLRLAKNYAQQELEIAKANGEIQEEVNALQSLGTIAEAKGSYSKALFFYQQIISLVEQTGRLADKIKTLGNIGFVYFKLQKLTKAKEYYEEAIFLAEREKNQRQLCRLYGNLGVLLENQGKNREALVKHQLMLKLAIDQKNRNWQGVALANIGNLQLAVGSFVEALKSLQSLLQISQVLGQKESESIALANIGLVHSALKRDVVAQKYLKSAVRLALKYGFDYRLMFYYQDLSKIEIERLQIQKALDFIGLSDAAAIRCNNQVLSLENRFLRLKCDFLSSVKDKSIHQSIFNQLSQLAHDCKDIELKTLILCDVILLQNKYKSIANPGENITLLVQAIAKCTKLWLKTGKVIFSHKIRELELLQIGSSTKQGI